MHRPLGEASASAGCVHQLVTTTLGVPQERLEPHNSTSCPNCAVIRIGPVESSIANCTFERSSTFLCFVPGQALEYRALKLRSSSTPSSGLVVASWGPIFRSCRPAARKRW
jgi:hypothetical protein